ncbi:F-box only protein 8-like isoform X1 [Coffea arabica]|uniref:F-box only protein 8-like isoform X1 n=1 Tax=Coffea arabica TaxID=13443 RepID=A0ABM4UMB1_COFAR
MNEGTTFLELPADVVMHIFSKLPVKSLLRFKAVCKYWCSLIQSPTFVAKHLRHHKNQENLLVHCYHVHGGASALSLFPDAYLAGTSLEYQDHIPTPTSFSTVSTVLGPVDGLVFIYNDHSLMLLWNPATREVKLLPPLVVSSLPLSSPSRTLYSHVFGFGKDPSTNDFKVVCVRDYWDDDLQVWYVPLVSVYTLSSHSWRQFRDYTFSSLRVVKSYTNTYLNGFYYWGGISSCRVFAFDVRNEIFREIRTPDTFKSMQGNLALYNDSLATFAYNRGTETSVDVWVMEAEGCWIKKVSIGPLLNIRRALGSWKTGFIFIETGNMQLALLNPDTKEIRHLGPRINCYCLQVSRYKESLVRLH